MKHLFCFLLTGMIFISLTACGANDSNSDANRLEAANNATADSSNFEPVDLSCENVARLTDFKCYVSYEDETLTIDGTRAKDLYNLVYNEVSTPEQTSTFSDGDYVYLVFYNSEKEFPSENINTTSFWGTYTVYDDGLLEFSMSPYHSAAFDYKPESDLYDSVVDIISGGN